MSITIAKPPMITKPIRIRSVNAKNLVSEMSIIQSLIRKYHIVTINTEFPGPILVPSKLAQQNTPPAMMNYDTLKANVEELYQIQIGITISDDDGNLPDLETEFCYIWEFNFREFDLTCHPYNKNSVELLKQQGIDFDRNFETGAKVAQFAELMMSSGLVRNEDVTWVTFSGVYDFAFLVKILTKRDLPDDLAAFLDVLRDLCGGRVYDVKHMTRYCSSAHGGLDRVAAVLGKDPVVGSGHEARLDSLLTLYVYQEIRRLTSAKMTLTRLLECCMG